MNVQQIELLSDGFENDIDAVTFMLMWFFFAASALFGFRHGDLKPANVMFRKLPIQKTHFFHIQPDYLFQITSKYEPVVIDYEFGSIFLTNPITRNDLGTYGFAPPEVLFFKATSDTEAPGRETYDFFSLGLTLLFYVAPKGLGNILFNPLTDSHYLAFRANILEKYGLKGSDKKKEKTEGAKEKSDSAKKREEAEKAARKERKLAKTWLYIMYNQFRVLYKLELLDDASVNGLKSYSPIMVDVISTFLVHYKGAKDQPVTEWYNTLPFSKGDSPTKTIILQLLSIHPMSRVHEGNVWSLIVDAFPFIKDPQWMPPRTYSMPKLKIFDLSTDRPSRIHQISVMNRALRRYQALAHHIECSACGSPDISHVSVDSGLYYCSERCYNTTRE